MMCWLLLSLISLVSAAEELPWTPVEVPGLEIAVSAAQHGGPWFHGDFGWLNAGQEIWITHDAGRSWTLSLTVPDSRGAFFDAYFLNDQEGWVAFRLVPHLFHTSDGGQTWQPVEVEVIQSSDAPVPSEILFLSRIYFKDSLNGVGTFTIDTFPQRIGSIVVRTEDGGQRWTEIGRSAPFPQLIGIGEHVWIDSDYSPDFGETFQRISRPSGSDFSFISPEYGWTVASFLPGNQQLDWEVLVTSDSGFSWSQPLLSLQGPICRQGPQRPLCGLNIFICPLAKGSGAVLWYSDAPPVLYFTSDGGASWSQHPVPVAFGHQLACNRERQELWLVPALDSGGSNTLFKAPISSLTGIGPSGKLPTLWGTIKSRNKY